MSVRSRWGVTLLELIVALTIAAALAAVVHRAVVTHHRLSRRLLEDVRKSATLRAADLVLGAEFRSLGRSEPSGSDLIRVGPTSVVYRATRTTHFSCGPPDVGRGTIAVYPSSVGHRALDVSVDSLWIFAEGDIATADDDRWLHADLRSMTAGFCPRGQPGLEVTVGGVAAGDLAAVSIGAPVRAFEVAEVRLYRDAGGQWWIGMRRWQKAAGRWPATQPVFGPLAPGGLEITALDADGRLATGSSTAAALRVVVHPARATPGPPPPGWTADLRIAFRNLPPR